MRDRTDLAKLGIGHRQRVELDDGRVFTGVFEHVDDDGTAILRCDDGEMVVLASCTIDEFTLLDPRLR